MGISRELTGTPWHVEKFTRSEGDEKRHRSRCFYHSTKDNYCIKYCEKCRGSAHCDYYTETPPEKAEYQKKAVETEQQKPVPEKTPVLPTGCRVKHKKFGSGTVTSCNDDTVAVLFDNGTEKVLVLSVLIKNKLLVRED